MQGRKENIISFYNKLLEEVNKDGGSQCKPYLDGPPQPPSQHLSVRGKHQAKTGLASSPRSTIHKQSRYAAQRGPQPLRNRKVKSTKFNDWRRPRSQGRGGRHWMAREISNRKSLSNVFILFFFFHFCSPMPAQHPLLPQSQQRSLLKSCRLFQTRRSQLFSNIGLSCWLAP